MYRSALFRWASVVRTIRRSRAIRSEGRFVSRDEGRRAASAKRAPGRPIALGAGAIRVTDTLVRVGPGRSLLCGSSADMSPEQAEGRIEDVSERSDVYGL